MIASPTTTTTSSTASASSGQQDDDDEASVAGMSQDDEEQKQQEEPPAGEVAIDYGGAENNNNEEKKNSNKSKSSTSRQHQRSKRASSSVGNSQQRTTTRWSNQRNKKRCPWCTLYSHLTLFLIMLAFFLAVCIATSVLTHQGYNNTSTTSNNANNWMLVGGVTDTGAAFRISQGGGQHHASSLSKEVFLLSKSSNLLSDEGDNIVYEEVMTTPDVVQDPAISVYSVTVSDSLESETKYYYGTVLLDDSNNGNGSTRVASGRTVASFTTAPTPGTARPFTFATAGCAWTGSNHKVFQDIGTHDPLFMLHLGDLHYADIGTNDLPRRLAAIDQAVGGSKSQSTLYSQTALVYMWDDHDYLGNDSGQYKGQAEEGARETALDSYTLAFPHYTPLPAYYYNENITRNNNNNNNNITQQQQPNEDGGGGMYHAFTIGTVRFIISDLRSEAVHGRPLPYSQAQRAWLYKELALASDYDFVVWVTTRPWSRYSDDSWSAWPQERRDLSAFISETIGGNSSSPQNLLVVSADAHMLAFDDGTNTYFGGHDASSNKATSGDETLSFPLLHSGPLDRLGSTKGVGEGGYGTFTSGCTATKYERNHQYSIVEFVPADDNAESGNYEPCLVITSYRLPDNPLASRQTIEVQHLCGQIFTAASAASTGSVAAADTANSTGTCESRYFDTTNTALLATSVALVGISLIQACFLPITTTNNNNAGCCENWIQRIMVMVVVLVMAFMTLAIGILIPSAMKVRQWDTFVVSVLVLCQMAVVVVYLFVWMCCGARRKTWR